MYVHLSVDGLVGCLHFLAVVTSSATNMRVQISLWYVYFINIHSQLCYALGCHPKVFTAQVPPELKYSFYQLSVSACVSMVYHSEDPW